MKHKHAELIKAWADGAEIEWRAGIDIWVEVSSPQWDGEREFRIKPEPKPDVVLYAYSSDYIGMTHIRWATKAEANLELIYDGDTLKLKGSQVIK
jgi:hypothetical protein